MNVRGLFSIMVLVLIALVVVPAWAAEDAGEACRKKLIGAQQLGVLTDLDWQPKRYPKVVVGTTFFSLPFETKQAFAETVNCFLLAGRKEYINFDLLDQMNHRIVGRWENGRLKMLP